MNKEDENFDSKKNSLNFFDETSVARASSDFDWKEDNNEITEFGNTEIGFTNKNSNDEVLDIMAHMKDIISKKSDISKEILKRKYTQSKVNKTDSSRIKPEGNISFEKVDIYKSEPTLHESHNMMSFENDNKLSRSLNLSHKNIKG